MDKPHLIHKKFTLPKGCSINSFTMREIDGKDELEAARLLQARGSTAENFQVAALEENLRISIYAVNGKKVEQPYFAMNNWSAKTRRFALEAWTLLNGVEEEDLAVFLGAAEDVDLRKEAPAAEELSPEELISLERSGAASG